MEKKEIEIIVSKQQSAWLVAILLKKFPWIINPNSKTYKENTEKSNLELASFIKKEIHECIFDRSDPRSAAGLQFHIPFE